MYDVLVGNSIVPDMVDDIIGEFTRMGVGVQGETQSWLGGVIADVDGFASDVLGKFGSLGDGLSGVMDRLGGTGGLASTLLGGPIGGVVSGLVTDFIGGIFGGDDKKALAEIDAWQDDFARQLESGRGNLDKLTGDLFSTVQQFMEAEDFSQRGKMRATSAIGAAFETGGLPAVIEALRDFPRLFGEFGDEFQALNSAMMQLPAPDLQSMTLASTPSFTPNTVRSELSELIELNRELVSSNRGIERNTSSLRGFVGTGGFDAVDQALGQAAARGTLVSGDFGA